MYTKKFVFTAMTMPALIYFNRAAHFQQRRREEKVKEA
jgi:hypothetical protein